MRMAETTLGGFKQMAEKVARRFREGLRIAAGRRGRQRCNCRIGLGRT